MTYERMNKLKEYMEYCIAKLRPPDVSARDILDLITELEQYKKMVGLRNKPPLRDGISPELWCKTYDENIALRTRLEAAEKELEQYREVVDMLELSSTGFYWFLMCCDAGAHNIDIAAMKESR